MDLIFVTGNKHKFEAAKSVLESDKLHIEQIILDIDEIQSDINTEVAIKKAKAAYDILKKPLIINDSSFVIPALNNFPSSYASYVEKTLGNVGILKLMEDKKNREAYYEDILIYIDEYEMKIFKDQIKGSIATYSLEGDMDPYDKIFIPEGYDKPVGFYSKDVLDKIYQNHTYELLKNYFSKRRAGRGIVFFDDDILLLERNRLENGELLHYYAIPGGGMEESETVVETIIRELKEELSINVKPLTFLDVEEFNNGVCYYYLVEYLDGKISLGGEEKEKNNPNNSYQIKLINIKDLDKIFIYGIGIDMIKKAYQIYNKK